MQEHFSWQAIAHMHNDFSSKFGIPRQSGLVGSLAGAVVFTPAYRNADALRGLEAYSHIWLIWHFSENANRGWSPTVRPPRLGGNVRMGVFATRSPFRPNGLGLSCVRLERIDWETPEGPVLMVSGADLMNGTPILDIKPYLPFADSHPEAEGGFAAKTSAYELEVQISEKWLAMVPEDKREAFIGVLAHDPRPAYQHDPKRIYGMSFAGMEIHFSVDEKVLKVHEILDQKNF